MSPPHKSGQLPGRQYVHDRLTFTLSSLDSRMQFAHTITTISCIPAIGGRHSYVASVTCQRSAALSKYRLVRHVAYSNTKSFLQTTLSRALASVVTHFTVVCHVLLKEGYKFYCANALTLALCAAGKDKYFTYLLPQHEERPRSREYTGYLRSWGLRSNVFWQRQSRNQPSQTKIDVADRCPDRQPKIVLNLYLELVPMCGRRKLVHSKFSRCGESQVTRNSINQPLSQSKQASWRTSGYCHNDVDRQFA